MKIFGLRITTERSYLKRMSDIVSHTKKEAYYEAVKDIVETLKQKEKIYLEKLTIVGSRQHISHCAFLGQGSGLNVEAFDKDNQLNLDSISKDKIDRLDAIKEERCTINNT